MMGSSPESDVKWESFLFNLGLSVLIFRMEMVIVLMIMTDGDDEAQMRQ